MEAPVDIVITIKNDNQLPKVVQKLLLDLELLLENFEQESTKHVIQVHHINVDTPKIKGDDLQKYNITEPNLISLHSPNRGQKVIFRYQSKESTNPYDLSQSFQSSDANARQLIWESGFYSDWKETGQGVLEPKVFRGEQVIIESILALVGPKKEKNVAPSSTINRTNSTFINYRFNLKEFNPQTINVTKINAYIKLPRLISKAYLI